MIILKVGDGAFALSGCCCHISSVGVLCLLDACCACLSEVTLCCLLLAFLSPAHYLLSPLVPVQDSDRPVLLYLGACSILKKTIRTKLELALASANINEHLKCAGVEYG